jgi:bacterioferritin-associated ferredoxin
MIICICKRVSDRDIAHCARAGMGFDELQWELGVATQCGVCESCARETLAQCQRSAPVAFISPAHDAARPIT